MSPSNSHLMHTAYSMVLSFVLLFLPPQLTGQNTTQHPRLEVRGATGLIAMGGEAFRSSASGVEFSVSGMYHVSSGLSLRASAGLSTLGDALNDTTLVDGEAALSDQAGFDLLLLAIGPVFRFTPPASIVTGWLGGRIVRMENISNSESGSWGSGLSGGMTFWLSNWFAVDSDGSATLLRRSMPGSTGGQVGHALSLKLGLILAID